MNNKCHNCKYFFRENNEQNVFICGLCSLKNIIINDADNENCKNYEKLNKGDK